RRPAHASFCAPLDVCMPPDLGPKPPLGYTATAIDRAAERRSDAGFLAALEADQNARAYAIGGELVVLKRNADGLDPLFTLADARALATPAESVFVGLTNGTGRLGVGLDPAGAQALKSRGDLYVTDLRSIAVQGLIGAEHLAALAEVKALLHWHARH